MNLLALFSDSHGNRRLLAQAVGTARVAGAEQLIHLGDYYGDMDSIDTGFLPVLRVPGLQCPQMHAPGVPSSILCEYEGLAGLLVHDPHAALRLTGAQLVFHGHTHQRGCRNEGGRLFLCPGHLKADQDRGECAGFAMVRLSGRAVRWRFLDAAGGLLGAGKYCFPDEGT
jgi:predicted phosphodiesterase